MRGRSRQTGRRSETPAREVELRIGVILSLVLNAAGTALALLEPKAAELGKIVHDVIESSHVNVVSLNYPTRAAG